MRSRRFSRRRRFARRSRRFRRKPFNRRSHKFTRLSPIYRFKRSVYLGNFVLAMGTQFTGFGLEFHLTDLPNSAEFQNLFDQYRIRKVKLRWIPQATVANPGIIGANNGPDFYYTADYDDSTPPSSRDQMMQEQGVKIRYGVSRPFTYLISPRAANLVYGGALATDAYAMARKSQWLDVAYPAVPHYGIKFGMWNTGGLTSTADYNIDLYADYYVDLMGPR